jgi:hypothetical protein
MGRLYVMAAAALAATAFSSAESCYAQDQHRPAMTCPVDHDQLADILKKSVKPGGGPTNGGLDNNEWAAVVDRQGVVCAVAYSGS